MENDYLGPDPSRLSLWTVDTFPFNNDPRYGNIQQTLCTRAVINSGSSFKAFETLQAFMVWTKKLKLWNIAPLVHKEEKKRKKKLYL